MDLGEYEKMDLCELEWMNMFVFLVNLENKVSGFEDKFYEVSE